MSPFRPRLVTDALRRHREPIRIGCSHPCAVDITGLDNLYTQPPHSLSMCNACLARWCTVR